MQAGLVPFDPTNTRPDADRNPNLHMNTYGLTIGSKGTNGSPVSSDRRSR